MSFLQIPTKFHVPLIILAAILVRIPILLDPNLMLDGDEAIVGLMAKDFLENGNFPIYFTGQQYGLSTIEAGLGALSFSVFGISGWALKISSLFIWVVGAIFFYKSLVNLDAKRKTTALLISIILVSAPTWLYWAMKSRGGYISAFTFSAILFFLLSKPKENWSALKSILIGICFALVSQFQQLWLIGMLPLSVYFIINNKMVKHLKYIAPAFLVSYISLRFLARLQNPIWNPEFLKFDNDHFRILKILPEFLTNYFNGTYYLGSLKETNSIAIFFAILMIASTLFAISFSIKRYFQKRNLISLKNTLTLCLFGHILIIFFALYLGARYILPTFTILLTLLFLTLPKHKKPVTIFLITLIGLGATSSLTNPFSNAKDRYQFETQLDKNTMMALVAELQNQNIKHAFTMNVMGQYQMMFYAKEKTSFRHLLNQDRMQNKVDAVNQAYRSGLTTAFVILKPQDRDYFNKTQMTHINDRVSIVRNPSIEKLKIFGFETEGLESP